MIISIVHLRYYHWRSERLAEECAQYWWMALFQRIDYHSIFPKLMCKGCLRPKYFSYENFGRFIFEIKTVGMENRKSIMLNNRAANSNTNYNYTIKLIFFVTLLIVVHLLTWIEQMINPRRTRKKSNTCTLGTGHHQAFGKRIYIDSYSKNSNNNNSELFVMFRFTLWPKKHLKEEKKLRHTFARISI